MSMAFGSDIGSSYEWRLGQRVFEVTRRNFDVNMLSFDGRNQRIQHALRSDGLDPFTADQEEIRRALEIWPETPADWAEGYTPGELS